MLLRHAEFNVALLAPHDDNSRVINSNARAACALGRRRPGLVKDNREEKVALGLPLYLLELIALVFAASYLSIQNGLKMHSAAILH